MPGRYYQPPHVPEAAAPCVSGQELAHAQESALNSRRNGLRSNVVHLFAVIGVMTVVVLTGIGSATIFHSLMSAPASYTLTADISELENPPAQSPVQGPTQVHGDCQCDTAAELCAAAAPIAAAPLLLLLLFECSIASRKSEPADNWCNWDIDVGGIGTTGGGLPVRRQLLLLFVVRLHRPWHEALKRDSGWPVQWGLKLQQRPSGTTAAHMSESILQILELSSATAAINSNCRCRTVGRAARRGVVCLP